MKLEKKVNELETLSTFVHGTLFGLHSLGVMNVVASSGTALTPDQINRIKEIGRSITIIARQITYIRIS